MRYGGIFCLFTSMAVAACLAATPAVALAAKDVTVDAKVTMSGPSPTMLPAGDDPGHIVGLGKRAGEAVFSDGRKAKYSNVFFMDFQKGKSAAVWGYTKMVFGDGDWLYFKWDSTVVGRDENGPLMAGKGTILSGAGTYKGIKGAVKFKNRKLPGPDRVTEASAVFTYTLPGKDAQK